MVNYRGERLDTIFHALSDETRRAILARLAKGECNVSELAEPFRMSLAAVSKHIKVLEEAGLIRKERDGRTFRCRPHFQPLDEANRLLDELAGFWQGRLAALEDLLTNDSQPGEKQDATSRKTTGSGARHTKNDPRKKRKGI